MSAGPSDFLFLGADYKCLTYLLTYWLTDLRDVHVWLTLVGACVVEEVENRNKHVKHVAALQHVEHKLLQQHTYILTWIPVYTLIPGCIYLDTWLYIPWHLAVYTLIPGCTVIPGCIYVTWLRQNLSFANCWSSLHDTMQMTLTSIQATFSALTLLVGWQEGHPACKTLGVGLLMMMIWLELCTTYSSSCHHSPPPSSLAAIKPANLGSPGKWPLNIQGVAQTTQTTMIETNTADS